MNATPEVMTLDEVAAYLRVSAEDEERAISEQGLPARKVDQQWRFLTDAVRQWLSKPDGKQAMLESAGAFKDDPTFGEVMKRIKKNRKRDNRKGRK